MDKKNNDSVPNDNDKVYADSLEMFEDVFREAIDAEENKAGQEKEPQTPKPAKAKIEPSSALNTETTPTEPAPVLKREHPAEKESSAIKSPAGDKKPAEKSSKPAQAKPKPLPAVSTTPKPDAGLKREPSADKKTPVPGPPATGKRPAGKKHGRETVREKSRKRPSLPVLIILIVLIVVLGGIITHHFGVIDFNVFIGSLNSGRNTVTSPAARVSPPPEERTTTATDKGSKQAPNKEKEALQVETGRITGPIELPVEKDKEPLEKLPPPKTESSPSQPAVKEKGPEEKAADNLKEVPRYPYSIYLGSYTDKRLNRAVTRFSETGLPLYWVKIDLGEKGIWFRLFAGYFPTRKEADDFINARQITEAKTRNTRYANLIGTFSGKEELERQITVLKEKGYSPYVISEDENSLRLYVGAHNQESMAQKDHTELASSGIRSRIVER